MNWMAGLMLLGGCVADSPSGDLDAEADGSEGVDEPAQGEGNLGRVPGAREVKLWRAGITLTRSSEGSELEIHLPVSADRPLPAVFELSVDPNGPRGTLTEAGPPARVLEAVSGAVAVTGCASAVDDLLTGRWDAVEFREAQGDEIRTLEGDFELPVVEVTEYAGACLAPPAPSGPDSPACALEPSDVCAGDAQPRCCTFRSGVDRCHAQCDLGACANPGFSGCLLCRQACIRNVVDAGCEDRYTRLGRCQFESGCVGSGDPSCTVDHCCDELAAALVTH